MLEQIFPIFLEPTEPYIFKHFNLKIAWLAFMTKLSNSAVHNIIFYLDLLSLNLLAIDILNKIRTNNTNSYCIQF